MNNCLAYALALFYEKNTTSKEIELETKRA
jgi:hypothetical protein